MWLPFIFLWLLLFSSFRIVSITSASGDIMVISTAKPSGSNPNADTDIWNSKQTQKTLHYITLLVYTAQAVDMEIKYSCSLDFELLKTALSFQPILIITQVSSNLTSWATIQYLHKHSWHSQTAWLKTKAHIWISCSATSINEKGYENVISMVQCFCTNTR